jgi:hypothetical protein
MIDGFIVFSLKRFFFVPKNSSIRYKKDPIIWGKTERKKFRELPESEREHYKHQLTIKYHQTRKQQGA